MHHQTCRDLWTRIAAVVRPAGDMGLRQQRIRLILLVALAVALWFAFAPAKGGGPNKRGASENSDEIPVLVAKRYIPSFRLIKEEAVEVRRFPKSFIPPGALNGVSELSNDRGQYVYASIVSIPAGQPLTRMVLIEAGQQQRLASLLHMGRVAVSFDVEKARAAGGWVQPGDTIAVFQTTPLREANALEAHKATRLLFSALQVLAVDTTRVGQSSSEDHDAEKNGLLADVSPEVMQNHIVTVLATPAEASALVEAREHGPLSVVLRAMGDDLQWLAEK